MYPKTTESHHFALQHLVLWIVKLHKEKRYRSDLVILEHIYVYSAAHDAYMVIFPLGKSGSDTKHLKMAHERASKAIADFEKNNPYRKD